MQHPGKHRGAGLLAIVLAGCGGSAEVAPQTKDSDALANELAPTALPDAADDLFTIDHVPTFSLDLPIERWNGLVASARDEQYVEAALTFEGTPIGNVGVRFKGNYGTLDTCFDAAGNLTCRKLSMKLDFAEYDPNLRFYGLKRLNFHAYRWDDTKIREPLAYSLYRAMGVVAPRASWANILVNGESYGLFGMVEQIDGRFTDSHWPGNGGGNLYKEVWPTSESEAVYQERLETNAAGADNSGILALAKALNDASGSSNAALATSLSQWMSLEHLRRYIVVDEAIMNIDGFTTVYTDPVAGWTNNHNYYFYQEQQRERFWLLPWDLEGTFWIQNGKSNVPSWTETPADCNAVYSVFNGDALVLAPGCDPIFRAIAADMKRISQLVDELLAGPFATERVQARVEAYAAFVADSIAADPKLDAVSKVSNFEAGVADIKRTVPILAERLRAIAKRTIVTPVAIPIDASLDFQSSETIDARMSVIGSVNAASSASVSVENDGNGNRYLRCNFELRDEATPWGQWATFSVPMEQAAAGALDRQGIHLRLRSSRPGSARIEFAGKVNWDRKIYDLWGWDINLTTEWAERDFLFIDAVRPRWYVEDPKNPGPTREEALATIVQVRALVDCTGRNPTGQLGTTLEGTPRVDAGTVDMDAMAFIP